MKICPNCKATLDDNARFCLQCMTSLEEKEQITPPKKKVRQWLWMLICIPFLIAFAYLLIPKGEQPQPISSQTEPSETVEPSDTVEPSETDLPSEDSSALTCSVDGVKYTFRPATSADDPNAITLKNHFVLITVEGSPSDGIYRVPSFVGDDTYALVTAIADGAFEGTGAKKIDLGHNVRYVSKNAFAGCALTELYLHEDVFIDQASFSSCPEELTIHCPHYLENTEGSLWSELAIDYGFQWQNEVY